MTRSGWFACETPLPLLDVLTGQSGARLPPHAKWPGQRKLRLFACACWHGYVRRRRSAQKMRDWIARAEAAADGLGVAPGDGGAFTPIVLCRDALQAAIGSVETSPNDPIERGRQAGIIRDLIGDPFGPTPVMKEEFRTAQVFDLAIAAYERRNPDGSLDVARLSILADALEEAGCDDALLLRHLRTDRDCPACGRRWDSECAAGCPWCGCVVHREAPHFRGCYALDAVLRPRGGRADVG